MELFESLRVGENVEIVAFRNEKNAKHILKSRIEDIYNKNQLLIPVPPEKGSMAVIGKADKLEIVVLKGSAKIIFGAIISDRLKIEESLYYVFRMTDVGKRIQDRSFFRVDVEIDVKFTIKGTVKSGTTKDISGGGMQVVSKDLCETGAMLTMSLDLLGNDKVLIIGKIMGRDNLPDETYRYRIKFIELSEKEQDKIIRFVLDLQRKEAMTGNVSAL